MIEEGNIFYQIKSLDIMIIRNILCDHNSGDKIERKITPTQFQIISYILNNINEDIYQKDLERVLNIRRATVSGVLKTMEKNGFIERIIDSNDTRTKKIILNQNIRNIFLEKKQKLNELEHILTKNIKEKDLEIFLNVISKIKDNIRQYNCNH